MTCRSTDGGSRPGDRGAQETEVSGPLGPKGQHRVPAAVGEDVVRRVRLVALAARGITRPGKDDVAYRIREEQLGCHRTRLLDVCDHVDVNGPAGIPPWVDRLEPADATRVRLLAAAQERLVGRGGFDGEAG